FAAPIWSATTATASRRRADEREILWLLERHVFRDGQARGIRREVAVGGFSSRRRVKHLTRLRAARYGVDIPSRRRGGDQHGSRRGAGLAQRLPRAAHRVRVAGRLHADQGIG